MSDVELTISANVDAAMKEVTGFRKEYADLVKQVEKPLRQVNSFRELESTLEQAGRKIRDARDRVRDLGTALGSVEQPTKQMTADYRQAVNELKRLERQEQAQIGKLSAMRRELQASGVDTRNLAAEQRRLSQELSAGLSAGRGDAASTAARNALGVGAIEQTQRKLVELRHQYQLVTSDSTLSAKQRAEAEATYRAAVSQSLAELRRLRAVAAGPASKADQAAALQQEAQAAAAAARESQKLSAQRALGVGVIEQTQRQLVELRQQYRLVTSDSTLSAKQRAEAEANYRSSVASTLTELRALRTGLGESGHAMQRAGRSAGQYRQAMQQLPMQLTDVVTSLASGMPLWMVAIQQGGQIRDSFDGIGNAARAVAAYITPMAVAVSAGTAALAGIGWAWFEGAQEAVRFNEALILTGSYARMTAGDLTGLAQRMDGMTGVTQRSASAALTQVVATGKFAGEQIELVAAAAEQMRVATGRSIEDTIAEFVKLGGDPVKAILDLNDQYHFLSRSQLEQIRSLQEQGRQQEAATEAIRTYAQVIGERTPKVNENLGSIEESWRRIKQLAGEAVDAMLDIGRAGPLIEQIAEAEAELARNRNLKFRSFDDDYKANELEQQLAYLRKLADEERERVEARKDAVSTDEEESRQKTEDHFKSYAENLRRQIKLHGDASEAAKVRYAIERGELGDLTEAQRQALIADAEMLDAIEKHQRKRSDAERKAASDLEAALKAQLDTRKRYSEALAGLRGAGGEASYAAAQALKVKAAQALASGDVESAKLNAQAALKMLQELAQAGESTFGFEGFIKSLQQIEESADQINIDKAKKALDEVKQKGVDLRAILDSVKSTTITVKMDDAAMAKVRKDIIDLAKLAGKPVELPAAIARQDGPAPTSPGTSKPSMPPELQGGSTELAPAVGGKPVVEADIVPTGVRQDGPASFTNLPPVEVDVLPTGIRQDGENSFTNLPPVDVSLEVNQEAAAQAQQQIDALAQRFRRQLVIPIAPTVAPVSGDSAPGFASGGYISGPGSGTSDSILARLSNGEYVLRADAVRHYGKALLDQINSRRFPGFATGGLVSSRLSPPSIQAGMAGAVQAAAAPQAQSFPFMGEVKLEIGGHSGTVYATEDFANTLRRTAMKFGRTSRR